MNEVDRTSYDIIDLNTVMSKRDCTVNLLKVALPDSQILINGNTDKCLQREVLILNITD